MNRILIPPDNTACIVIKAGLEKIVYNSGNIAALQQQREEYDKQIDIKVKVLEDENRLLNMQIDKLKRQGYCAIDKPYEMRDKLTGNIKDKGFTHQSYCRNKKEKRNGLAK